MAFDVNELQNHYFALRHGKSKANELGIIVSNPEEGIVNYGLAEEGKEQVRKAVQEAKNSKIIDKNTVIYSSDFKRCRETSEIARDILQCAPIHFTVLLRERYFGVWEKTSTSNYQKVWDLDAENPDQNIDSVESANAVLKRVLLLIYDLEKKYQDTDILLVSHGDALQILQTAFSNLSTAHHRRLPLLVTAEIRELTKKANLAS